MPRPTENRSDELQSKWASLWFMQRAQGALQETEVSRKEPDESRVRIWQEAQVRQPQPAITPPEAKPDMWPMRTPAEEPAARVQVAAREPAEQEIFSLDRGPSFLERSTKFATQHWHDAILAVVVVTLGFGVFTAWPKSANHPTWFQSLMVRTGIMQPHTKVFAGAPDARVWIDVHTQLYYCSGEDLYGKTPDGEFTTQYNAQSDGFLPASNTACP